MPMELGHLPEQKRRGRTKAISGLKELTRLGITKWREYVPQIVVKFMSALDLDDGRHRRGRHAKLDKLPPGCRAGNNAHAFRGGFLL